MSILSQFTDAEIEEIEAELARRNKRTPKDYVCADSIEKLADAIGYAYREMLTHIYRLCDLALKNYENKERNVRYGGKDRPMVGKSDVRRFSGQIIVDPSLYADMFDAITDVVLRFCKSEDA